MTQPLAWHFFTTHECQGWQCRARLALATTAWWPWDQEHGHETGERTKPLEGTSMTETHPQIKRVPGPPTGHQSQRPPKPPITPHL